MQPSYPEQRRYVAQKKNGLVATTYTALMTKTENNVTQPLLNQLGKEGNTGVSRALDLAVGNQDSSFRELTIGSEAFKYNQ